MVNYRNYSKKEQAYALYGTLLGDASYDGSSIRILHTNKQRDYIKALAKLATAWKMKFKVRMDFKKQTTFGPHVYSEIRLFPSFSVKKHLNKLYLNGKKHPNKYVLNRLNKLGMLLWWLDDGSLTVKTKNNRTQRFGYLNTHGFTASEQHSITAAFAKRWNINLTLHKDTSPLSGKTHYRHYFNATNMRKFIDEIYPVLDFIPANMIYKVHMNYVPNRLKQSESYALRYNFPDKQTIVNRYSTLK